MQTIFLEDSIFIVGTIVYGKYKMAFSKQFELNSFSLDKRWFFFHEDIIVFLNILVHSTNKGIGGLKIQVLEQQVEDEPVSKSLRPRQALIQDCPDHSR